MTHKKLGKLPAKRDIRTYKLTAPISRGRIQAPPTWNWGVGIRYDMNGNDQYGDCAFATRTALLLTWTTHAQAPIRLTEAQTLADYAKATGFNPETGANDNGTVLLDALNMWRREGFNRNGQTDDYLTCYGLVDHKDHDAVKRAIYTLGGLYLGIQVPKYIMDLSGDWNYEPTADWTNVGGHCIAAVGYTDYGPIIYTWGATRRMSWQLWDTIVDECYGLVSLQDQVGINGRSPLGLDIKALVSELREG